MILIGIIYGAINGKMADVTNAALDSAGDAVSLCITMIGVMALWVGLMEIAQKSGLIAKMTRGIQPFISFLFPGIPKDHPAREYISMNLIANVLGLGWACTPAGLKAMEALAQLERERAIRLICVKAGNSLGTGVPPAEKCAPFSYSISLRCSWSLLI